MKKLNSKKFRPLTILFSLLISACATVPPDVAVLENLKQRLATDPLNGHLILKPSPTCMKQIGEAECCHGTYIMSGREIYIGEDYFKATWMIDDKTKVPITLAIKDGKSPYVKKTCSQLIAESIHCPAEECYAPLSTYIINSCKKMNCSDQVDRFKVKIDSLNGISGAIHNP